VAPDPRHADYDGVPLDPAGVDADPIAQFRVWFAQARDAGVVEPDAMTLATVGPGGRPSARIVLLRGLDERGFAFFTSRESAKGRDLRARPHAALTFAWLELHRSVRVEGPVSPLPDADADAYFASRPRGSQIGAWASPQSRVLATRAELDRQVAEAEARFAGGDVPRPPHWGGFVVAAASLELWQGRPSRLHDRVRYVREADGTWRRERLAP
jgi:pyridoxamine 5'-phosphate oxidase